MSKIQFQHPPPAGGDSVCICMGDQPEIQVPRHTPVREVAPETSPKEGLPILGALVNNDVCSMSYPLSTNARIEWLCATDREGIRIFKRTVQFLLGMVVQELFPEAEFTVDHALNDAVWCRFRQGDRPGIAPEDLVRLQTRMDEIVTLDLEIERAQVSYEDAISLLTENGEADKINLMQFNNSPRITLYRCENYVGLFHGVLAPRSSVVTPFKLLSALNGVIIQFPVRQDDGDFAVGDFNPNPRMLDIFEHHRRWGKIVGLETVGDLNERVAEGELDSIILTTEAMHERELGRIADQIALRPECRWICMAGPSSAGKTTTSYKLATHLKVNGLRPVTLECDNYFIDREHTPKHRDGRYNFEHIEAIDLNLLNTHLRALDRGDAIELPRFDFLTGQSQPSGRTLQLAADQIVIIEGIHGLNPRLTEAIPEAEKFRIYISCITQLRLDRVTRLSTTDMRLLRRIVRDGRDRGHSALRTLQMWPSVRQGEHRWVFPFQNEADAAFNSSLEYELAIFAELALPLLREIKPVHREYAEARRLQDLLEKIQPGRPDAIPPTSILREFIGGSIFGKL